jgi:ferric-dicitrate binding protein FerR (iron transport regulator)
MNERSDIDATPRSESDDVARILRAIGRRPVPPRADYDAVRAAARSAWQAKLRARRQRFRLFAAAACVFASLGGVLVWTAGSNNATPLAAVRLVAGDVAVFSARSGIWAPVAGSEDAGRIMAGDRVRTAGGAGVELEWSSRMSVRLAERTEIEVDAPQHLRLIAGTVYVDSGDDTHGLVFDTPHGTLRDIGTRFEVRSTNVGLRVRVRSGRVELTPTSGPTQLAGAEEQLEITGAGQVVRSDFPAVGPEWAWAEQLAVVPLPRGRAHVEYLAWIAAETGYELRFASESARLYAQTYRLDGDPSGFTPAALLAIIERSSRLEIERPDDSRTMRVTLRDIP